MGQSNLTAHVNNSCTFFKSAYYVYNSSSVPVVFRWFFTWIALNYADLHFPFTPIRTANVTEEETKWAVWLHHHRNQHTHIHTHVTDDVGDSFCKKTADKWGHRSRMPTGLNRKLSRKFRNWCKFSDRVKAKSGENKSHNTRPACIFDSWFISRVHFFCPVNSNFQVCSSHEDRYLLATTYSDGMWHRK
jgi:hypothetical protein